MDKLTIAYGIGQLFHLHRDKLKIDYVCDKRFGPDDKYYENYSVITIQQLLQLRDPAEVIVFVKNKQDYSSLKSQLTVNPMLHVNQCFEVFPEKVSVTKDNSENKLGEDGALLLENGNSCYFKDGIIPEKLEIVFWGGSNNSVSIGEHISINDTLHIDVGTNATVQIGNDFRVTNAKIIASFGKVSIGNDCLFSTNIGIRNVNGHHIFSKNSKKRIDTPKDVYVADNVWVCENVNLLPGASIGTGSIVGANSVTSSSFGDHLIVAGNPAKVIRKDIVWSRDSELFFSIEDYSSCYSTDFLRYI